MTNKKLKATLAITFFITVFAIAGFSYSFSQKAFVIDTNTLKDTIRFEIIKSLLQLLVIIIIGGIISALFKSSEANREQAKIKLETWKDCLKRISRSYQNVKRVRRTLTAGGLTPKYENTPVILTTAQLDLYVAQMQLLNNEQLELEGLKTEAKYLPDFFSLNKISGSLGTAEDYLRLILKEYEANLPLYKNSGQVEFLKLERLCEFTTSTKVKPFQFQLHKDNIDFRFKTHFAETFDAILLVFNAAFKQ